MVKLQLSFTEEEAEVFRKKAEELGYSLTKFVKFLLSMEAYKISEELKDKQSGDEKHE